MSSFSIPPISALGALGSGTTPTQGAIINLLNVQHQLLIDDENRASSQATLSEAEAAPPEGDSSSASPTAQAGADIENGSVVETTLAPQDLSSLSTDDSSDSSADDYEAIDSSAGEADLAQVQNPYDIYHAASLERTATAIDSRTSQASAATSPEAIAAALVRTQMELNLAESGAGKATVPELDSILPVALGHQNNTVI